MHSNNLLDLKNKNLPLIKKTTRAQLQPSSSSANLISKNVVSQKENQVPNKKNLKVSRNKDVRNKLMSLDQQFFDKPNFVSLYAKEIFEYKGRSVCQQLLPMDWLVSNNFDSNLRMKSIEFFIQWSMVYNFSQETLFLAIYLFDKMAQTNQINKLNVSNVFICANHLASKYLETFYFPINDFLGRVSSPVAKEQVIQMEEKILDQMGFNLSVSNPFDFLQRLTMIINPSVDDYIVMNQIVEVFLFNENLNAYKPEEIAIAAYRYKFRGQPQNSFTKRLKKYFSWSESKVQNICQFLDEVFTRDPSFLKGSLRKKYLSNEFVNRLRLEHSKLVANCKQCF